MPRIPLDPAALLCGSCAALTCHARRHWNSTSYRTAAGSYSCLLILPIRLERRISLHGAEGNRTPDLCSAIAALSQLSYSPAKMRDWHDLLQGKSHSPVAPGPNIKALLKNAGLSIDLKIRQLAPKSSRIYPVTVCLQFCKSLPAFTISLVIRSWRTNT